MPYLDIKTEYLFSENLEDIKHTDAPVIDLDLDNTLASLSIQLTNLYEDSTGSGFPIVATEDGGRRMFGYISSKELEYGLVSASNESPKTKVTFNTSSSLRSGRDVPASRASTPGGSVDFSFLVEISPITISKNSPMELAHEMFSKLGVRYLVVVDERGFYTGLVEKNRHVFLLRVLFFLNVKLMTSLFLDTSHISDGSRRQRLRTNGKQIPLPPLHNFSSSFHIVFQ